MSGNHRRVKGERSKKLQRLRSELTERTFAHVCETGGARRCWLHGILKVSKRYLIQVAARNFGADHAETIRDRHAARAARRKWRYLIRVSCRAGHPSAHALSLDRGNRSQPSARDSTHKTGKTLGRYADHRFFNRLLQRYNGGMDDKPSTADLVKPRRRWFQFRLRTLLVGVVLIARPVLTLPTNTGSSRRGSSG